MFRFKCIRLWYKKDFSSGVTPGFKNSTCSGYNPFFKTTLGALSFQRYASQMYIYTFICFHSAKPFSHIRERLPPLPPHYHTIWILCSPLNTCNHYLLQTGQKQLINHFAEYRIPWAVATFTNCLRFKANDGDFCSGALSDLFSSLASRVSVSRGAHSYCHSAHTERGEK